MNQKIDIKKGIKEGEWLAQTDRRTDEITQLTTILTLEAASLMNCLAECLHIAGTVMTQVISLGLTSSFKLSFSFFNRCSCN